jgi:hypothetical protein
MRVFADASGRSWEVVVGRQSWGAIVGIFVPRDGVQDLRESPLSASGYEEGTRELDALDLEGLRSLLARSVPKEI